MKTRWTMLGTIALVIALTSFIAACGGSDSKTTTGDTSAAPATSEATVATDEVKQGLKLAFFSVGGNNTYLKAGIKGAQDAAQEYGATIDVFDGAFDGAKQLNQVTQAVSSGKYDGIVVEPNNSQQLCSAIDAAIAAGLAVGVTNVPACDAAYETAYEGTTIFVGGQGPTAYKQWFEEGFASDPAGGEFAVLNGPATHGNTIRAREVLDELLLNNPQWKEVGFDYTDYQASIALTKTSTILQQNPKIKVLFSSYAGHTPGLIAAVKAAGLQDQVKIYDLGGDQTMFAALKKGEIASTMIYLPYEEQYRAVQSVVAKLSGLPELGGVKVGTFWDLTTDPRLEGLPAFVEADRTQDYEAIGLPEY